MFSRFRGVVIAALIAATGLPASLASAQQTAPGARQSASGAQSAPEANAGSDEPVLVVSIASLDRLIRDVNYVTGATGAVQAGGMFSVMVATFSEGVDRTRPLGVIVPMIQGAPAPVVMVPVQDVRAFLRRLENQLGQPEELDDGTLVVRVGANQIYIRELDGWAFAAQEAAFLENLPADPLKILQGLAEQYDIGIRFNVQAVPAQLRQLLVDQLEQGFRQGLEQQEQGEEDRQVAEQIGRQGIDQLKQLINETDMLQIGLGVLPQEGEVFLEVETRAQEGSQLAKQLAEQQPIPTRLGGFIQPDAAAYAHAAASIGPAGQAQAKQALQQGRQSLQQVLAQQEEAGDLDSQTRQLLQATLNEALSLIEGTIDEGISNGGAVLRLDNNQLRFLLGLYVADGEKAEAMAKRLAEAAQGEPGAPKFQFNVEEFDGVRLHTGEVPIPEDRDEARKIFGATLPLVIGTADKAVYFGLGQGATDLLKQVVEASKTPPTEELPMSELVISLLPIIEFAQWVEPQPALEAMVQALRQYQEQDELTAISQGVERGQRVRITAEEGLLRAIGAASQARRAGQPQF